MVSATKPTRPIVLVVDNDPLARDMIQAVLKEHFEVLDAPDGSSGVQIARSLPVDVVILDLVMPGTGGFTVLAQLRRARPGLPVIVVTAVDTAAAAVEAKCASARPST